MPTALIAEDEPMLAAQLRARLADAWPELGIVGPAQNGNEAVLLARTHHPDIAFLDIRTPGSNGLEVARTLAGSLHVVFVTAYDEYAVAAFEEGAVDYLLKPVAPDRIAKVVARLKARLKSAPLDLGAVLARLAARDGTPALRWVRASLGNALTMIAIDDVIYFQSEDKYTKVVTRDGEGLIKKPIKELYEELDPDAFWQVHRATIVNLTAIARVERDWRDQPVIHLKERPETLIVSRSFAHRFKAM